ncbi:MAG: bifunctional precorrin-2 dehydrogenase/sirohydrochlorin ferrochelatase [Lachnospiraceae bacterium]|nr:bifunctional precorrin-2 dehydrogenase/sirohydrochlorin ferrochelatase [Lachnospiraceae bacterium]
MAYFPLFVNLENKKILIVGGGTIAERRARTILPFAGEVTVIAKELSEAMKQLSAEAEEEGRRLRILCRAFDEQDLASSFLVLACTDDGDLNSAIVRKCRERGIPANNCSDKEECDFFFPGLIYKDPFVVGFTASGKAHGQVKRIREKTEQIIDEIMHGGEPDQ